MYFQSFSDATNLISGIGNAWAWHNKAKLCPVGLRKILPINSLGKVGARDPIGSVIVINPPFTF